MNRSLATVLLAGLALAASAPADAQQRVAKVGIDVRDAVTDREIEAIVEIDGERIDADYLLPPDSESSIVLDVSADAGDGYYARSMTVFLEASAKKNVRYIIYLAPRTPSAIHNRRTVAGATRHLSALHADRAVALLEAIAAETSPSLKETQFGLYLNYNLWRAYFINCTMRFVDNCSDATSLGETLVAMHPRKRALFDAESISVSELKNSSMTITDHSHRLSYLRAKWDLARNHPEDAAETLEKLLGAVEADPALTGRLKITKKDILLARDAAKKAAGAP